MLLFNSRTKILVVIIIAATLRILYAMDIPLSGDEGVAVLQASGQAVVFKDQLHEEVASTGQIKEFINYSKSFSIKDVFASLRYAGMHPPSYYMFLHYVLKYMGNGAFLLRLISIFISLLSVLCIYQLGKRVYNEDVGWCSALLLAISPYGVMYGVMVRPYPLAMLLSLVSTYQAYELTQKGNFGLNNRNMFLYVITVLMGLYTIYHFLFVFVFQMAFLVIHNFRNKKGILTIGIISGLISILYLPWCQSLLDQLAVTRSGSYYFHGDTRLLSFINETASLNFTGYMPDGFFRFVAILITAIAYLSILIGCYLSFKERKKRVFITGIIIYLLTYFAVEKIMGMNTLHIGKFFFFIIPISFLLLAGGIFSITNRLHVRTILISLCCGLLLCNTVALCFKASLPSYVPFDGPRCTLTSANTISRFLEQERKGLILINTSQRRYLLPLAHAIKNSADIKIIHSNSVESDLHSIDNLKKYDYIFILNYYVGYENQSFLPAQDIKYILDYLVDNDYKLAKPKMLFHAQGQSSLMIFERTSSQD